MSLSTAQFRIYAAPPIVGGKYTHGPDPGFGPCDGNASCSGLDLLRGRGLPIPHPPPAIIPPHPRIIRTMNARIAMVVTTEFQSIGTVPSRPGATLACYRPCIAKT